MRAFSQWIALATLVSGVAYADKNDIQISRLGRPDVSQVQPQSCTEETAKDLCSTGNARFQAFARTFGAAMTSANLMPPETLGHSGFNVNMELSVISMPGETAIPAEGGQPSAVLMPAFHVRKGLPFSIEVGGRVGWVERSRMIAATGEVKWAVNEGFRYLPDIGVRGHVTRLMGVRDFGLTAAGIDAGAGYQFPLGGMVTITPYGGLDFTFVAADSNVIDFDPDRTFDESLEDNSLAALENTGAYKRVGLSDNMNQRIYGGVRFIGGVLQLGAEISVTRLGSVALDPTIEGGETRALTSVFTFNTSLGLDF